jgi:predicted ArsR family transcriptional regulator
MVYSLTETGMEKFPTRYLQLTNLLLTQLKLRMPENEIESIFSQIATSIASDQAERIKKLPIEEKLNFIKRSLAEQGFDIEWEKIGEDYKIREVSCPFYHVGQEHPEVCLMDQTLISAFLSAPTQKVECVLDGDNQCSYIISKENLVETK